MSRLKHWITPALVAILIAPLSVYAQSEDGSRSTRRAIAQSQAIAADFARTELALSPETASRLKLERIVGPNAAFALDNHSQAGFERRRLVRIELAQRLLSRPALPAQHPLTRDLAVAEHALQDLIALEQLGFGRFNYSTFRPYAIDPYSGIWIEGPDLLVYRQSINNADEAAAFVARLNSLSAAIDDTRRRLIADQTSGLLIPRSLLDETQRRVDRLLAEDAAALRRIAETFDALTRSLADIEVSRRAQLLARVETEITAQLVPAYTRLSDTLNAMREDASDHAGVWAQRRGQDIYSGVLAASLGDSIPSERLHERHMADVTPLADAFNASLNVPEESAQNYPPRPEPLSETLAWYVALDFAEPPEDVAEASLPTDPLLALAPQSIWAEMHDYAAFAEQAEAFAAFETFAALDANEEEANSPPVYRQLVEYSAIRTAWRHYVWETLPPEPAETVETILDVREPGLSDIAHNRIALIRATLAAVDTGIHLDRWTVEDATEFVSSKTALSAELSEQLVLRIVARPGYHTAVASAWHRINGLSERARAVLGEQYSEAAFQSALIGPGPRPLYLIEQDIEAWYGAQLTAPDPN